MIVVLILAALAVIAASVASFFVGVFFGFLFRQKVNMDLAESADEYSARLSFEDRLRRGREAEVSTAEIIRGWPINNLTATAMPSDL